MILAFCLRCHSPFNSVLDQPPLSEQVAQLAQEVYSSDLLEGLVKNLKRLDFEVRLLVCINGYFVKHTVK